MLLEVMLNLFGGLLLDFEGNINVKSLMILIILDDGYNEINDVYQYYLNNQKFLIVLLKTFFSRWSLQH